MNAYPMDCEIKVKANLMGQSSEAMDQFHISVRTEEGKRTQLMELVDEFRTRLKEFETNA